MFKLQPWNFTVNKVLFTTRVIERKRLPFLAPKLRFNVNYETSSHVKERCFKSNDLDNENGIMISGSKHTQGGS